MRIKTNFVLQAGVTDEQSASSGGTSVDQINEIANMLTDEGDTIDETLEEENEVAVDEENQEPEEGLDDSEEPDDSEVDEDDSDDVDEEDATWSSVLGIADSDIVLSEDGDLKGINVKVDGETSAVSVKDLITGYSNNKSFTSKSQALAGERKEFDTFKASAVTEYTKKLQDATALTNYLYNSLVSEFQGVDWQKLRVEDPAEYAAMSQDYNQRNAEIKQVMDAINVDKGNENTIVNQQQAKNHTEHLKNQMDIVITNNPTWSDKETFRKDFDILKQFAIESYGYTQEQIDLVQSASDIEVLKDAMKYRQGKKAATEKRLKKLPKYQKSTNKVARKKATKLDKLTKAARTATGDNKRDLQSSAIAELLIG